MHGDLKLSNADQGLVSGIFFVGYVFLQIPAAVPAQRWSARKTVVALMIPWAWRRWPAARALVLNGASRQSSWRIPPDAGR